MRALLLAAGLGTRLRPLTETLPKCLVPINGRALLDYWLDLVFAAGVERALVNAHWLAEQVVAHVGASPWRERADVVVESDLLGTAGTLRRNRGYFGAETLMLAHADALTDFDLAALMRAHAARPHGCILTMLAFRTDDPRSCGILEANSHGVLQRFHEKVADPPGNLANAAVYLLEPELADGIAAIDRDYIDFSTEILPNLMGRILVVESKAYYRDIGSPESLRRARAEFSRGPVHRQTEA
jgi:mannose-1-phosphate guanylyltransferase